MSLDIQVRVDTSQALPAADKLEAELHNVENAGVRAGKRTGDSMRDAARGMGQASSKAESLGSMLKQFAGAAGISFGVQQVLALSDSYSSLENRLKTVATSTSNLNDLMARTKDIAIATRSDWSTTGEAFTRLSKATKEMGMSQERALGVTKTLNMALQSSGASSNEASAATLQLMQALRKGYLNGDEFNTMAESMGDLLDMLSKKMGVSTGQLKELGSQGKITREIIIGALEDNAGMIEKTFLASVPTMTQQWAVFKTELMDGIGSFMKQTQLIAKLGDAMKTLGSAIKPILNVLGDLVSVGLTVNGWIEAAGEKFELLGGYARSLLGPLSLLGKPFGLIGSAIKSLVGEYDILSMYQEQIKKNWLSGTEEGRKFNAMLQEQIIRMNVLTNISLLYAKGGMASTGGGIWGDDFDKRTGFSKFKDRLKTRGEMFKNAIDERVKQYEEWQDNEKTFAREDEQGLHSKFALETNARSTTDFSGVSDISTSISSAELQAVAFRRELENIELAAKKYQLAMASANDGVARGFNKISDEIHDTAQLTENVLVNAFHNAEDALVQFAMTGKLEFKSMVSSMIADLIRLQLRKAIAGIIDMASPGVTLGPGVTPLPGYASGGSFMVGGHGGTDTTPIAFMATPGERVTVETQGQQSQRDDRVGGPMNLSIYLDERDAVRAIESPDGQKVIARVIRKMFPQLRTDLTGR